MYIALTLILLGTIGYAFLVIYVVEKYYRNRHSNYIGKDVHKMGILENQQVSKRSS